MTPEKVKELASHIQNNDDACSVCWEAASALSAYAALLEAKAPPEATGLLRPAAVADARTATPEQLRRGADIAAALREPSEPQGWQPIETAPKDGTEILLTNAGVVGAFTRIASYSYTTEKWITVSGNVMRPSHWMPLPSPPSTKGAVQE